MKNALVTGATGFVGSHLVARLRAQGVNVWAICRDETRFSERFGGKGVHLVAGDLRSDDWRGQLPADIQMDVLYHLAWEGSSGPARADERIQWENVDTTLRMVRMAQGLGCQKVVVTGTVYERLYRQVVGDHRFMKAAYYILSKRYARDMAAQLSLSLQIPLVWCTFCHPIGRYIKPDQLMAYTISEFSKGHSPSFGPAAQPFDIIAVEDLAYGLYLASACELRGQEYYIGSGTPRPMHQYLEQTKNILKMAAPLSLNQSLDDGIRYCMDWYDMTAFVNETGFAPKIPFDQAVRNTADWICENAT